jgi:hypothetical protein
MWFKGIIRHIVTREAAIETMTLLRIHIGVQRLCFVWRMSVQKNELYLMGYYLECILTYSKFHTDHTYVSHTASGVLYHLDLIMTSEVMLSTAHFLQMNFLK